MSKADVLKPTLMSRLQLRPEFHRAIKALKLVEIASTMLSYRPLRRTLPNGTRYRVRYGESLLMADEIFNRQVYRDPFDNRDVRTFVDLGSNVGYFTCYAMERIRRSDAFGIAVDANPKMAAETKFHIDDNGWRNVQGIWGVVGFPSDVEEAPFFLNPSNISGSATVLNPNIPAKGTQTEIKVPTVDLNKAWRDHAGDARVDVLKVDVEGFEVKVLDTIPELLQRTESVVIEWHKWITPRDPVDDVLGRAGLRFEKIVTEDPHCGVAYYARR
ncbi:MAG TPA: FkbM family methyltransferase [Kofleriaceae bacterium]